MIFHIPISSCARCGIIVNVTPFEPEWEGYVALEFSSTTLLPAKIYAGGGGLVFCSDLQYWAGGTLPLLAAQTFHARGGKDL